MREMTVATVMTKDPVTVAPETDAADIRRLLARHCIGAVAVVADDRVPIGVVSAVDVRGAQGRALDLMAMPVRAVGPNDPVGLAARELNRRGVRRLFVVEHGRLVGVVSRRDLLRVFLRSDEEIQADVEREVLQRVLWAMPATVTASVNGGVVTLNGQLTRRSEVEIAGRLTATIPGVVDVRNRLEYAWNDAAHH